jgi:ELWxxDGT repeat protein
MVADIARGSGSSGPADLVAIGSTVYFVANDGDHGNELWKTNGTAAGTTLVADIWPGGRSSYVTDLTNVNGTLFFAANDGIHGEQLWKSDGTAAGTTMVLEIAANAYPANLTNVNGTLFFSANNYNGDELWKSDGTAAGTTMVEDLYPGGYTGYYGYTANSSGPANLTNVNGTLFFTADVGPSESELFKSDGTAAGTVQLTANVNGNPHDLTNVNGTMFFAAYDTTHGTELWKSDGTVAGTTLVKDIAPGGSWVTTGSFYYGYFTYYVPNSSNPGNLTNVNGTLFFTADNGTHGQELWKSDGTAAGTVMVADIRPGSSNNSYVTDLTNVDGTLFFAASGLPAESELWKSDGTTAGTVMVSAINSNGSGAPSQLTNLNGTLYFSAVDGTHGAELWRSDGTAAGTTMVADINPGSASSHPADVTNVNGVLYFAANDGTHGQELWALNTAPAPSLAVSGFPTSTTAGTPGSFTITSENADGSIDTGYTGTVHFSSTDGQAALPSDYTFTAADAGVHTFTDGATLKTAGTQSLTATDLAFGTTGSEAGITVLPGTASRLGFAQQPGIATAGQAISPAVTVLVEDQYGNVITTDGSTVTVTLSSGTFAGGSNTATAAASGGVATFSTLTIDTSGSYTLKATDGSLTSATSAGFTVQPAAAGSITVAGFPSPTTAGATHNFTVTLEDPYGNVASGYRGTVHFTSNDRKAALPANYTFTAADAGAHTFSATLKTAGTQSLTATDTTTASITGTQGGITVTPAGASRFLISAPSSVHAGVAFSLTLSVEDAYGNVVTGYTGTVHLSSTDTRATLPRNYTFTAADQGVHTFTGLVLRTRGFRRITITDTLNTALTGNVIVDVL